MKKLGLIGDNRMSGLNIEIGKNGVKLETTIPFTSLKQISWLAICTAALALSAVLMAGEKTVELPDVLDPEK